MNKNIFKKNNGFTIIETMISISIFLIVVMIGMNSLLNASLIHNKSSDQRSIMDNLTFIMEEMSRNIRTGYNYRCVSSTFSENEVRNHTGNITQNCSNGGAIVFENALGIPEDVANGVEHTEDQWVYKIEANYGENFNISKSIDGGVSFVKLLNGDEIKLNEKSGFTVTGAKPSTEGDEQQPLVTIRLVGEIINKGVPTPFAIQTTVSQRNLDQ